MPKLRPDMQQGVVVAWLKQPGEPFQKGDAIYEVESDKVVNQIEAERQENSAGNWWKKATPLVGVRCRGR